MISSTSTVSSPRCKRTSGTIKGTIDAAEDTRSAEEIAEEVFRALPDTPPERVRALAEKAIRDESFSVIRGVGRDKVLIKCSECEMGIIMPRVKRSRATGWGCKTREEIGFRADLDGEEYAGRERYSGDPFRCPCCGEETKVAHVSELSTYGTRTGRELVGTSMQVLGRAVVVSWYRERYLFKDGNKRTIWREGYAETVIRAGKRWRVFEAPGAFMNMGGVCYYGGFRMRKRASHDLPIGDPFIPSEPGEFTGTETERARLSEYEAQNGIGGATNSAAYLRLWAKYPNVEALVQAGGGQVLSMILSEAQEIRAGYYREKAYSMIRVEKWMNPKKTKPHAMLGISKEQFRELIQITAREGWNMAETYLTCAKAGVTLTNTERIFMYSSAYADTKYERIRGTKRIMDRSPAFLQHAIRYLGEQENKHRNTSVTELADYWDMIEERLGEGHTLDHAERWAKDLKKAHDKEVELAKARKEESKDKGIRQAYRVNLPYSFTDRETGLCIRPVRSAAELTEEGTSLHHCVATYAGRIAEGKTEIFLIRRIRAKKTPYFTLEYRNGTVIQNRGLCNCARTTEVIRFEEKWLEYLKTHQKQIKERIKRVTTNV